jgi:periplasmic divalent cation tolerance protein
MVVLITAPLDEAPALAASLVKQRVAACVNLIPGLRSWFWWEGAVDEASEALLVAKTTRERLDALIAAVRESHSYQVFGAVALPIVGGYAPYLEWIASSVSESSGGRSPSIPVED